MTILLIDEEYICAEGPPMEPPLSFLNINDESTILGKKLAKGKSYEIIIKTLYKICNSINTTSDLKQFLLSIQTDLDPVVDTAHLCVALFDKKRQKLQFPLYQDTVNCLSADNRYRNRTTYLAEDISRNGQPLLLDEEAILRYKPAGTLTLTDKIHQKSWLGIPLRVRDTVIGALILQSYTDPNCYNHKDMSFLLSIAKQLSIAIDHKQKEEELWRSEDHYRAIFENSPLGIFLFDHHGVIIDCNQHSANTLKLQRGKLIGTAAEEILPNATQNALHQAIKGTPSWIEDCCILKEKKNTNYLRFTFNPVNPDSLPTSVICLIEDITEKKRIEESARVSREQIQVFFSTLNDAVFVHSLQSEGFAPFLEVNEVACKRYGYRREEFLQLTVHDITDSSNAQAHARREHRRQLLEKGQLIFEAFHIKKSGERFPVEINANVTEQFGRKVILAVARDISERVKTQNEKKTLEARLYHAQKMELVGRFAGGVAHDFNNKLSVILGHTELLLDQLDTHSSVYDDVRSIHQAASHSAELTKQLLAFARKQAITPKTIDINDEISSMMTMLRRLIGENIELKYSPKDNCWPVLFDPAQIDQIITNLCLNARDAIKSVGKITIKTENLIIHDPPPKIFPGIIAGEYTHVAVTDSGSGIDEKDLPYIFEPFFTTKEAGEGTGLGLSTVFGILKQNKGYIYAYSLTDHTVFSVLIPRYQGKTIAKAQIKPQEHLAKGKETILLVEDEAAILNLLHTMLTGHGYNVIVSSSPSEALKISQEHHGKINLLLTDVVMPEMNGYELAKEIKAANPQMECLYMSGYESTVVSQQDPVEKKIQFIQKPFTKNHLLSKISSLFQKLPE